MPKSPEFSEFEFLRQEDPWQSLVILQDDFQIGATNDGFPQPIQIGLFLGWRARSASDRSGELIPIDIHVPGIDRVFLPLLNVPNSNRCQLTGAFVLGAHTPRGIAISILVGISSDNPCSASVDARQIVAIGKTMQRNPRDST